MKYLEGLELRSCLKERFEDFRLPTKKPDTVREQVMNLEQLERPGKKSQGQTRGGRGHRGTGAQSGDETNHAKSVPRVDYVSN